MFCPKCGSILRRKKENDNVVFYCSEHGVVDVGEQKIKEKMETKKKAVVFVNEEEDEESKPKTQAECPKCGNKEAYFWSVQTRAADEAPTRFYRCTKCGHTWREYS